MRNIAALGNLNLGTPTNNRSILSLADWYIKATVYDSGNDRLPDLSGNGNYAANNGATYLAYTGTKYVWLPGIAGEKITTPDVAGLDIVGDIDLRVQCALTDWTPSALDTLVSKWNTTGDQRSFQFVLNTDGTLRLGWSTSGAAGTVVSADSTVATGITDGAIKWVRATLDVDNGDSGYDVNFYTSDDGSSWTQLGDTVVGGSTTSIFSGSAVLTIGDIVNNSNPTLGKFYSVQVYSGIGGTKVADFTPQSDTIASNHQTITSAFDGKVYTMNYATTGKHASIVDETKFVLGTDDYFEMTDNPIFNFGAGVSFTMVGCVRSTDVSDNWVVTSKLSSALDDGWSNSSFSGTPVGVTYESSVQGGLATTSAPTDGQRFVQTYRRIAGTEASLWLNKTESTPGTVNPDQNASNAHNPRIGATAAGTITYADMEFVGAAIFRRALTDQQITQVVQEFTL